MIRRLEFIFNPSEGQLLFLSLSEQNLSCVEFLFMPGSFSSGNIGRCLSDVLCAVVGHKKRAGMLAVSMATIS